MPELKSRLFADLEKHMRAVMLKLAEALSILSLLASIESIDKVGWIIDIDRNAHTIIQSII